MPTTWNAADKESHITLTGANLIGTGTAGWTGSVRATVSQTTGKFYWETLITGGPQIQSGAGMFRSTVPIATVISGATNGCGVIQVGSVYVDASTSITVGGVPASGIVFSGITSGTTVCIAVDLTAQLIWFRMGAAGNWNNNAARNPATGAGGVSIPNLGGANAAFPVASFGGADVLTGNFGDSAFVGAVPAGFNTGFPGTAPGGGGTTQARAMVLA